MNKKTLSRSILCTPATMTQFKSAINCSADIALMDLEDSIPLLMKDSARLNGLNAFKLITHDIPLAIRINSIRSFHGLKDIIEIINSGVDLALIHLPKVEYASEIRVVSDWLVESAPNTQLGAIIESPLGLSNLNEISATLSEGDSLVFGAKDFSCEMGIKDTWDNLLFARYQLVMAAKKFKVKVIDSPSFEINDMEIVRSEATMARDIGFDGKLAIHPSQVPVLNEVFTNSENVAWANEIINSCSSQKTIIKSKAGRLIGPPDVKLAQKILNI